MKRSVMLMSAILALAPLAAVATGPVEVHVVYLGHNQYMFKKQQYNYDELVQAVKSTYQFKQIGSVVVNMGGTASELDKHEVCQLRQSLLVPTLQMFITVDDAKQVMYCN